MISRKKRENNHRVRRMAQSAQGRHIIIRGKQLLNFSSNDYLGYAGDERLARSARFAASRFGTGAGASPLVSGWLPPVRALEKEICSWQGCEASLVFSSGFAANVGLITSLVRPEDGIFSDSLNHASIIDGCRLSRATVHVYRHCDLEHLEEQLRFFSRHYPRRFIVSDSVFSMDGDWANVSGLVNLAKKYDAYVILDEAHATGIYGPNGQGLAANLADEPGLSRLFKVGTLSKAIGSQGGFIAGPKLLIELLVNQSRPYLFSTGIAPSSAAAARTAIQLITQEPERRLKLLDISKHLSAQLSVLGFSQPKDVSPIIPIILGDSLKTLEISQKLHDLGCLVPAIRPPSVPPDGSRLRISLRFDHHYEDADYLAKALQDVLS
ncbi:MAG: aminotransferase class I/II-fold pyridoxal phosphate-dependent enzyme, partial [Gemmataceae bacterium]